MKNVVVLAFLALNLSNVFFDLVSSYDWYTPDDPNNELCTIDDDCEPMYSQNCYNGICTCRVGGCGCNDDSVCDSGTCDLSTNECTACSVAAGHYCLCQHDQDCTDTANCYSRRCRCREDGCDCTNDSGCNSGSCEANVCTSVCVLANGYGQSCAAHDGCAGAGALNCYNGCCTCTADGCPCTIDTNCDNANCDTGVCTACTGVGCPCALGTDCAAGINCYNGECRDCQCACTDLGCSCAGDGDCDSRNCVRSACECTANGCSCTGNNDCQSGICFTFLTNVGTCFPDFGSATAVDNGVGPLADDDDDEDEYMRTNVGVGVGVGVGDKKMNSHPRNHFIDTRSAVFIGVACVAFVITNMCLWIYLAQKMCRHCNANKNEKIHAYIEQTQTDI